jgi:hypothetical protein
MMTLPELEAAAIDAAYTEAFAALFTAMEGSIIMGDEAGGIERMNKGLPVIRRVRELLMQAVAGKPEEELVPDRPRNLRP